MPFDIDDLDSRDPLSAARGIFNGFVLGLVIGVVGLVAWWVFS